MIRPHFDNPVATVLKRQGPTKSVGTTEHVTQVSPFGYNPALERRLDYYELNCEMADGNWSKFINVNYLLADPVFETAHRSDVSRIETSAKMSIKPQEEHVREEEFPCVTTSFKKTIEIMLVKKFETFFTAKMTQEEPLDKQRNAKLFEKESKRKADAVAMDSLTAKGLAESYDEQNFLKNMKGPFYRLISKEGIREDDLVNCA